MTAKDLIINSIDQLVQLFPNVRARYESHEISNTHFVEVVPNEVYNLDKKYEKWEEEVTFDFIKKYPEQNLCFLSDDAIVGINNVQYEKKGVLFEKSNFPNEKTPPIPIQFMNFHTTKLHQDFFEINSSELTVSQTKSYGISVNFSINPSHSNKTLITSSLRMPETILEEGGESLYSIAA